MSKEKSSNNFAIGTAVTVAALGVGAALGYLFSENTNTTQNHQHRSGSGNRREGGSGSGQNHLALPAPKTSHDEGNQPRNRAEECVVCLVDIRSYPSKTMKCRHRVHQSCLDRMQATNMSCPTCSGDAFLA